jgi:hypothetical protein
MFKNGFLLVLDIRNPASRVASAGFHWGFSPGLADSYLLVLHFAFLCKSSSFLLSLLSEGTSVLDWGLTLEFT